MTSRVIALDLDGTLLTSKKRFFRRRSMRWLAPGRLDIR